MEKAPKFSNAQKEVFHAFSFRLCSTASSKFSFMFHFVKLITLKSENKSSFKSIYFSTDSLCFIYFDVIIRQRLK